MDSYALFSVFRIVLVSIVHGISLSILVRGGKRRRAATAIVMAFLVVFMAAAGAIIVFIAPSVIMHVSWTAYMMLLAMGTVFCCLSTGSALTERLFVYIMYVAAFMLSVGYAGFIAGFFSSEYSELITLVIRTFFSVILIILLKIFLRDSLYKLVDGLSVHGLEITMFSWLAGLCVLQYSIFSFFFVSNQAVKLAVLLLMTLMIISVFAIAHRIVKLTEREVEMEKVLGRQRLLESELEAEKAFVERAKAIRHDQRHHDRTVLEYLNEGKIDEARRYLGAHDESVMAERLVSWCSNPLVDSQLRIAWRAAAAHGIAFNADIQLGKSLGVDDICFVSVMGNLLENAIQAATGAESPSVSVSSRVSSGKLLLEIRNTFSGGTPSEDGTGLASVKHILLQYSGMLVQECQDGVFISRVIMPLQGW